MTRHAFIRRGLSGWAVAFWDGEATVRYMHGFDFWCTALLVVKLYWDQPPDYQNGFCTVVRLRED